MTSKGLGQMFEGDSADMCAGQFPVVGGWRWRSAIFSSSSIFFIFVSKEPVLIFRIKGQPLLGF